MLVKHGSVPSGVGHSEDQELDAAVAKLEPPAPLLCLQVLEPRLRLDGDQHLLEGKEAVPRAEVAWAWQRNLRVKRRSGRQERSKPAEDSKLPGIDGRSRARHRTSGELQAHRRGRSTQLVHRHMTNEGALDPTELRVRHSNPGTCLALADGLGSSRAPNFATDVHSDAIRDGNGIVEAARAAGHTRIIANVASPRLTRSSCGAPVTPRRVERVFGSAAVRTDGYGGRRAVPSLLGSIEGA
jgi:hypothetical protein